ncbi:MAG: M16 family metallopeptidase [Cyclobacteriaceae bacterium]
MIAPVSGAIQSTSIRTPESVKVNNHSFLHILSEPCQGAVKFELSFPRNYDSPFELVYLATRMLQEGTDKLSSKEIADRIAYYGAFLEIKLTNDFVNIELYCLKKFFGELAPLVFEIITTPSFPEKELTTLKNRYLQQLSNNLEKTSYLASLHAKKELLGMDHPYASNTLDPIDTLETISIHQVISYYTNHIKEIAPTFFLTGDVEQEEINLIIKLASSLTNIKVPSQLTKSTPKSVQQSVQIPKEGTVQQTVAMGKVAIAKQHPDFHKLSITNSLLGGFFGSRLMKNIREDKGYTYGIYSRITSFKHASFFYISTDLAPEHSINCINEIKKEITLLQNKLVDTEELMVLKNYLLGQFSSSVTSVFDHMRLFKSVNNQGLTLDYYKQYLATLESITSEEIQQMAISYLDTEKWLELTVG